MSNKNVIKEMFAKQFDKDDIYNNILSEIKNDTDNTLSEVKGGSVMKSKLLKYSLAPICIIAILCIVVFNQLNTDNDIVKVAEKENYEIYINNIKDVAQTSLDADMRLDVDIRVQEEFAEYKFINDIKIPSDLQLTSKYLIYTKELYEDIEKYKNAPYDVLHDYVLQYEKFESDIRTKNILIAFSKDFQPLRDYFMDTGNLEVSKINNTELTITSYKGMYMATFSYNNLNFDIETQGITQDEFIELLESIIR